MNTDSKITQKMDDMKHESVENTGYMPIRSGYTMPPGYMTSFPMQYPQSGFPMQYPQSGFPMHPYNKNECESLKEERLSPFYVKMEESLQSVVSDMAGKPNDMIRKQLMKRGIEKLRDAHKMYGVKKFMEIEELEKLFDSDEFDVFYSLLISALLSKAFDGKFKQDLRKKSTVSEPPTPINAQYNSLHAAVGKPESIRPLDTSSTQSDNSTVSSSPDKLLLTLTPESNSSKKKAEISDTGSEISAVLESPADSPLSSNLSSPVNKPIAGRIMPRAVNAWIVQRGAPANKFAELADEDERASEQEALKNKKKIGFKKNKKNKSDSSSKDASSVTAQPKKDASELKKDTSDFKKDDSDFKKDDSDFKKDDSDFKKDTSDFKKDDSESKKDKDEFAKEKADFAKIKADFVKTRSDFENNRTESARWTLNQWADGVDEKNYEFTYEREINDASGPIIAEMKRFHGKKKTSPISFICGNVEEDELKPDQIREYDTDTGNPIGWIDVYAESGVEAIKGFFRYPGDFNFLFRRRRTDKDVSILVATHIKSVYESRDSTRIIAYKPDYTRTMFLMQFMHNSVLQYFGRKFSCTDRDHHTRYPKATGIPKLIRPEVSVIKIEHDLFLQHGDPAGYPIGWKSTYLNLEEQKVLAFYWSANSESTIYFYRDKHGAAAFVIESSIDGSKLSISHENIWEFILKTSDKRRLFRPESSRNYYDVRRERGNLSPKH